MKLTTKKTKRRAPLSIRTTGAEAAMLSEAAAVARVSRHQLVRQAALGMARTLLETAPTTL
jgi:uncharacterized protein (DUF1778 family)